MSGHSEFERAFALGLRRVMRFPVTLEASLRSSAVGNLKVQITDISENGCQCRKLTRLIVGAHLTLVMPNMAPLGATVVWVDSESVGLKFNAKMHASVVEHIAALSMAQGRR